MRLAYAILFGTVIASPTVRSAEETSGNPMTATYLPAAMPPLKSNNMMVAATYDFHGYVVLPPRAIPYACFGNAAAGEFGPSVYHPDRVPVNKIIWQECQHVTNMDQLDCLRQKRREVLGPKQKVTSPGFRAWIDSAMDPSEVRACASAYRN